MNGRRITRRQSSPLFGKPKSSLQELLEFGVGHSVAFKPGVQAILQTLSVCVLIVFRN
jgi:hypothetical protein